MQALGAETQTLYNVGARVNYPFYLEYVHHGLYIPARHHLLICEALQRIEQGSLKRLIITIPPRHGKSATVSESFPSWYLGRNPNKKVMVVSYGDTLSRDFGRKNRQKLEEFGKQIFNVDLAKDNNTATDFSFQNSNAHATFLGIMGGATGKGCNLLIIDDPIKSQLEANSTTYRDRIYDEYKSSLLTRLTPDGAIILIMTRWHEDDLIGRVLKDEPNEWEHINLPVECEDENDPLKREIGEPLWSEYGFNKEWIEQKKRAVGSQTFASLYQQRPAPADGNIFKRKWFKYYRELPELEEKIISVDATFKDAKTSDFCVMQVWGRQGANRYLIDQIRDRMDFPTTVNALRNLVNAYPDASAKLIEDKANGSAVIDYLKNEISGLVPINPDGGKVARAQAISPFVEAGNVFLPEGKPWVNDYVQEHIIFPNGKNDDMVDCTTQTLNYWNKPNEIFFGRA